MQIKVQALSEVIRRERRSKKYMNDDTILKELTKANPGKFLKEWGLQSYVPALYGIPHVYLPNHERFIWCFVRDIFHDLDAGIFPAVLTDSLRIIQDLDPSGRVLNKLNSATSNSRMNKYPPEYKNVDFFTTWKGVPDYILGPKKKKNTGSCGNSGGMRSSWVKGMIDRLLLAIGDSNDVLPDDDEYVLRKPKFTHSITFDENDNETEPAAETTCGIEVAIKNPARLICMVLFASLDVYYEFMRKKWTKDLITNVVHKARRLQTLHAVLHYNMVAICRKKENDRDYEVTDFKFYILTKLIYYNHLV
jgi:hypothetical protein